jgi:hypothetical protein
MKRILFYSISFFIFYLSFLSGLSFSADSPGKVSIFTAVTNLQIKLDWTAPGDNDYTGDVTGGQWNIKYSVNPSATPDTAESSVTISSSWICGSNQTTELTGLIPDTTYYIWIKARDGAGNWSVWSDTQIAEAGLFADIGAGIEPLDYSSVSWGDYDNDGDLDLAIAGLNETTYIRKTIIYRNDNGTFTDITGTSLLGLSDGGVSWGDYDNDGDLDLAVSGRDDSANGVTKIYRNDNGSFTDINADTMITGVVSGNLSWGDYDNDGDLDLAIAGYSVFPTTIITKIYKNNNGTFSEDSAASAGLIGMAYCSLSWGDYDNDGDLDLAIAGMTSSGHPAAKIYRNSNGVFSEDSAASAGLIGVGSCSLSWGDYDNDGDLDLAVIGNNDAGNSTLNIYRNDNGLFNNVVTESPGVFYGNVSWGDYDNDGDLDLIFNGYFKTRIYRNDNGSFTSINPELPIMGVSSLSWGDYDNDGDLDLAMTGYAYYPDGIATKIYKSFASLKHANSIPNTPLNLSSSYDTITNTIKFNWNKATDDHTPSEGLYYEIQVATQPINSNLKNWIISVTTGLGTGYNSFQRLGNYPHGYISTSPFLSPGITLSSSALTTDTTYYWQARAIDTGLRKSLWSLSDSIYIKIFALTPVDVNTPVDNYSINFTTITFDWNDLIYSGKTISNYELKISTDINFGTTNYFANPVESSATITSIDPNKTYYWKVRAKDTLGTYSAYSSTRSFSIDTIAPSSVSVTAVTGSSDGKINLSWNMTGDNGISGTLQSGSQFAIQYSTWSGVVWSTNSAVISSTAGIAPGTLINYSVTGLQAETTYYFVVWYKDKAENWSAGSVIASTMTLNGPPSVPILNSPINSFTTNYSNIDFSWYGSTDTFGISNYELEISTDINFGTINYSSNPVVSSAAINSMDLDKIYYWRVRAVDSLGVKSNWSLVRQLILGMGVYQFTSNTNGLHKINLNWIQGANPKYRIDISTDNINWNLLKDNITGHSYEAARLKASSTYYFSLRTYDSLSVLNVSSSIISGMTQIIDPSLIVYENSNNVLKQKFTVNGKQLEVTIEIPEGAVSETSYMNFNFDPLNTPVEITDTSKIQQADNKLGKDLSRCGIMIEFNLYNMFGDRTTTFLKPIKITIPYLDENNDGIIDFTDPALAETSLKIYFLDETKGEWILAGGTGGTVDAKNNTITVEVTHFSVYGLASSPAALNDLSKVIVYPNPYKPGTGKNYDRSGGILFDNLTQKAKIKIYTIVGNLVREMNKDDMNKTYQWNAENDYGAKVASGVYIYIITNPDKSKDKAKGKIAIIR